MALKRLFHLITWYRISRQLYLWKIPVLPHVFMTLIGILYASYVPYQTKIGKNLRLGSWGMGIVLNKHCSIGDDCTITAGVVIAGNPGRPGAPKIGNRVWVGPGAKVLGDIVVGDDVVIGANAVVTKDVPPNVVVAGIPAKIIKTGISAKQYQSYKPPSLGVSQPEEAILHV